MLPEYPEFSAYQVRFYLNNVLLGTAALQEIQALPTAKIAVDWKNYREATYTLKTEVSVADKVLTFTQPFAISRYTIFDAADLQAMQKDLSGNYMLAQDVYMPAHNPAAALGTPQNFLPIGYCDGFLEYEYYHEGEALLPLPTHCKPFTGTLDGKGFTIHHLYIDLPSVNGVGLFGVVEAPKTAVRNLTLSVRKVQGRNFVGALAGYVRSDGAFKNLKVQQENLTAIAVEGVESAVGGLIGIFLPYTTSQNAFGLSYVESLLPSLEGRGVKGRNYVGGVIGESRVPLHQLKSITSVQGSRNYVGGLVGILQQAHLTHSYVLSSYIMGEKYVGGLVGSIEVDGYINGAFFRNLTLESAKFEAQSHAGGIVGKVPINAQHYLMQEVFAELKDLPTTTNYASRYALAPEESTRKLIKSGFTNLLLRDYQFTEPSKVWMGYMYPKQHELETLGFDFQSRWKMVGNALMLQ